MILNYSRVGVGFESLLLRELGYLDILSHFVTTIVTTLTKKVKFIINHLAGLLSVIESEIQKVILSNTKPLPQYRTPKKLRKMFLHWRMVGEV
jgi:hypothetical protein